MNIDKNHFFANQNIDLRFDECVGESVADILGNKYKMMVSPGFSYGAMHWIQGTDPSFAGGDPYAGMAAAVVCGVLPIQDQTFNAMQLGEQYEADYDHYSLQQKADAFPYRQKGIRNLSSYAAIANYLMQYQLGALTTVKWYESFMSPNADGSLPPPVGDFTYHATVAYDITPLGLQIKPHLGPDFGDHGYCYISPALFPQIFTGAYGFDDNASRFLTLVRLGLLDYPQSLSKLMPYVWASATMQA